MIRKTVHILRNRLKLTIGIAVVLSVALAAVVLWPRDFLILRTAEKTFYIDMPFEDVRKILVRTEATDQIMAQGDTGQLKEFEWTEPPAIGLASFNIFKPQWNIQATAMMKVQTSNEEYVGSHLITLKQDVDIQNDHLLSTVLLEEGSERLKEYKNITRFSPDGTRTKIDASLTLGILVTAPNFVRSHAEGRVLANAESKLASQEAAIQNVVEENKNRPLVLFP